MRAWVTTDSHFGKLESNVGTVKYSKMWFDIMVDYYENLFIPTVEENKQDGDILIHCGDVFDKKDYLEIKVMNYVINLFERLGKMFSKVYIICGNHDIYYKDTVEVNSLECLKYIPNVEALIKEHKILNDDGKRIALVPWQCKLKDEKNVLKSIGKSDYYFAHTQVIGAVYSGKREVDKGNYPKEFKNMGQVYTGHIHTTQEFENFKFLGSPYELTRNDKRNDKYFMCVDFQTGEEIIFENTISPRFVDLSYDYVKNNDISKVQDHIKGNFVDLNIESELSDTDEYEKVQSAIKKLNPKRVTENTVKVDKEDNPIEIDDEELRDTVQKNDLESQIRMYLKLSQKEDLNDKVQDKIVSFITKTAKEEV